MSWTTACPPPRRSATRCCAPATPAWPTCRCPTARSAPTNGASPTWRRAAANRSTCASPGSDPTVATTPGMTASPPTRWPPKRRRCTSGTKTSSWVKNDLDAAVLLLLEHGIGRRPLVEGQVVGGHVGRTQRIAVVDDEGQDVVGPAPDVGLAHPDL